MGRMEERNLTGISIPSPLSRTPKCYPSGEGGGAELLPCALQSPLGPLVPKRAQKENGVGRRREAISGRKWWEKNEKTGGGLLGRGEDGVLGASSGNSGNEHHHPVSGLRLACGPAPGREP